MHKTVSTIELASGPVEGLEPFPSEFEPVSVVRMRVSLLGIPVALCALCVGVVAGWLVWQTWTATPASAFAPQSATSTTGTPHFHSVPEGSPASATPSPANGRLEIGSEPPGAQVEIDGVSKGRAPLALADVPPGRYRIRILAGDTTVDRTVNVAGGTTFSLVVATALVPAGAAVGGWLSIEAPVELDIIEDGRVLGSTKIDRLMLPAGLHQIELTNRSLEFSATRTVHITAGMTSQLVIAIPTGRLSVNAAPWADVSFDGATLGTTPLGDVSVPIGEHELVFRHPQFGERRQPVTVKAQTATRIGVDLTK